jgi:hypothetical protein
VVELEPGDVVLHLRRQRRELAVAEAIETAEVAQLGRAHEELPGVRRIARRILLFLVGAEERRQLAAGELVDLARERAGGLGQEQPAVRLVVGNAPQPVLAEHALRLAALELISINGIGIEFHVIGAVIDEARVVGGEFVDRLHAGLVLNHLERPARGRLEVEAGVLLALAIAREHEVLTVGRDGDEPGRVLAAGHLHGEAARPIEAPHLRHAGDVPAEVEPLAVGREDAAAGRAHVEHRLDPPRHLVGRRLGRELRQLRRRDARRAVPFVAVRPRRARDQNDRQGDQEIRRENHFCFLARRDVLPKPIRISTGTKHFLSS